ncbi:MAG: Holliday junction resolvase-like protein [Candidatus Caenarcaniphilales bacterium]|nr:Holliday junction resolvase-like protein [Candidatus Caenarcaniphilales bacterium]
MSIEQGLLSLLIFCLFFAIVKYFLLKSKIESKAKDSFDKWRDLELTRLKNELKEQMLKEAAIISQTWQKEKEAEIRKDAVSRSKDVIKGQVTEHLLPYFEKFPYNPRDVRFFGSPIDLVVFDGLSEGLLKQIIFIEIKAGKFANLTDREKQVQTCIDLKRLKYEIIRV